MFCRAIWSQGCGGCGFVATRLFWEPNLTHCTWNLQNAFFSLSFFPTSECRVFGVSISYSWPIDKIQAFKQEERTSQRQDMAQQPFSSTQAKGGPILPSWGVFLAVRRPQGGIHPGSPAWILSTSHLLWGFTGQIGLRGVVVAVLGQQGSSGSQISHIAHDSPKITFFSLTFSLTPGCQCFGVSISYSWPIDKIQALKQEEWTSWFQEMAK